MSNLVLSEGIDVSSIDNVSTQPHIISIKLPIRYTSGKNRLGLTRISLPYSWFNLTASLNNITGLSYIIGGTTFTINFPPGFYDISDLNEYFQDQMFINGHYLVDAGGNNVFYLSFTTNSIYFRTTLVCSPVPTVLPSGWTNPAGLVLSGNAPQIVFSGATNFRNLLGFDAGTYPPTVQTALLQYNGQVAPVIDTISAVNITCNWINASKFSFRPNLLASFVPDNAFGSMLAYSPFSLTMLPVRQYEWDSIEIGLYDQAWRPLAIDNPNQIQISLQLDTYE